ncbi:MAG: carbohydrate porin [Caulobacteraceae bacterium]|nr:carbohydrate porin [Caulobacteraceae bacterium]
MERRRRGEWISARGFADGDTTPFDGGWQAGILVNHVFSSRPESMFSIGFNQAFVTDAFRLNQVDVGVDAESYEGGIEITYADTFGPLTIQPDLHLQEIPASMLRNDAVVGTLRFTASF